MTKQRLRLRKATNRNTQAYEIELGPHTLYISYETVIGYCGPVDRFRLTNLWGPTTGRHINEMGLKHWDTMNNQGDFNTRVGDAIGFAI